MPKETFISIMMIGDAVFFVIVSDAVPRAGKRDDGRNGQGGLPQSRTS
jgi:hypothetical protein